ncbi:hypothetical protein GM921_11425 [Pedobacter sp. LMG 31464]|uniref:Uncharacterized protein n=1 Tax=Pedobacter planticolens TaxID=2679964 RepID=A0A923IVQ0_9SPHI|nr:hypothetical protein [Pedobacter planticolens]MBB2146098.1 hypothetical protein [Pedobacter planticolens]
MPELLLLCVMLIPQIVAGVFAKSMGRNFWFWFFISFLIPIISLIILLFLDDKIEPKKGYDLADHVKKDENDVN